MRIEEIKRYIEDNEKNIISDLKGLVDIPSISSDKTNVKKALDYVLQLAQRMGFEAKSVLDHQVGVIEIGEGDETIGILSHVDVVPPGNLQSWSSSPFDMKVEDGCLWGRGTLDDKGAIIVCLYAMKCVLGSGQALQKKIQMILGTQEEVEWSDMEGYVANYPLPDYGFTPDGEFPLCNIEKGCMDVELRFACECEGYENGWYLTCLHAGQAANSVPDSCTCQMERYRDGIAVERKTLTTGGKAVHSCQPEKGENAIFHMADLIAETEHCENQISRILAMLKAKFASLYGAEIGLYSEGEMYNGEFVHRNVFAPTLVRMEDDHLLVNVNVRFAYGTSEAEITDAFMQLAQFYGGTVKLLSSLPAVYVSKERPFMKAFGEAYEEGSGRKHEFVLAYGGSYAKAMPNIVSWGPIFPGDEDTCHEENEHISIKSLLDNGKVFAIALNKVALSKSSFK